MTREITVRDSIKVTLNLDYVVAVTLYNDHSNERTAIKSSVIVRLSCGGDLPFQFTEQKDAESLYSMISKSLADNTSPKNG
jgi:hypothetical protein